MSVDFFASPTGQIATRATVLDLLARHELVRARYLDDPTLPPPMKELPRPEGRKET